jgi:protein-tyrosine-phosphatase|tara:strand:+ start:853 stop:1494 length:642 start_codon:yes stop_codon:yes gene_type:complete
MTKKLIEAVCTANNGRSPLIERIGRNHLISIGANKDYDTISSGTMVDAINRNEYTFDQTEPFVNLALKRGNVFSRSQMNQLSIAQKTGGILGLYEDLFNIALQRFVAEEHTNKSEAIERYEITGSIKEGKDQTVPRKDVVAVLPADKGNYNKVLSIYVPTEYTPTIAVLSQFATGNPNAQIENAFGKSKEEYMTMVERMLDDVPKAINRIVGA